MRTIAHRTRYYRLLEALIIFGFFFAPCLAWAQAKSPAIRSINPVPQIREDKAGGQERGVAAFHGEGKIDRIEGDEVVIDDQLHQLTPDTDYRAWPDDPAFKSEFIKGRHVRFRTDRQGRITTLWIMRR